MDSRDELALSVLLASGIPDIPAKKIADAILAAGYRKVPDDAVVVGRSDAGWILDYWFAYEGEESANDYEVRDRLRAALSETDHE